MGLPVKFYTDEHVAHAVVRGLRHRGADVLSVVDSSMLGASDEEQLEFARVEGRVLFTQEDFLTLHSTGFVHAGIAYAPQGTSIGDCIRGLMLIHQVLEAEDMEGRLEYL